MKEYIRLSPDEFSRLRPMNGHLIVKTEQDVNNIEIAGVKIYFDGSYNPENNQAVINRVLKVPDDAIWRSIDFTSEIIVSPGDLVWINYYSVMQATTILVEKDKYLLIPYRQCYMALVEEEEGPKYEMLNDYVLLDPVVKINTNPLIIESKRKAISKRFFNVERVPFYGSYAYSGPQSECIDLKQGDIAFMLDSSNFKLEHPPHYVYDKRIHYVSRIQKVLAVVDQVDETVLIF